MKIGPSTYTIIKHVCLGCKFHKSYLITSGNNPLRDHYCLHPKFDNCEKTLFQKENGKVIGNNENTPSWCPFLTGPFTKEKIENLLNNLEFENSGYDKITVTNIEWGEHNSCTIDFDIEENDRGTMGRNKIKINPTTEPKICVVLHERFEGGGDEKIIEEAILNLLKQS